MICILQSAMPKRTSGCKPEVPEQKSEIGNYDKVSYLLCTEAFRYHAFNMARELIHLLQSKITRNLRLEA